MGQANTTVRLALCNEPNATYTLRRALDRVSRESHLSNGARFELGLAATEALTNALKGAPSDQAVEVAIEGSEGVVDVEVLDRRRFEPRFRQEGHVDAEGGRGIPLMLALVDEIEFASVGGGTRVRLRRVSA